MHAVVDKADSMSVTEETSRGARIQARLDALGIGDREFHARSGIDRKTLRRVVANDPRVRTSTYLAIESWLDSQEAANRGLPPDTGEQPRIVVIELGEGQNRVVVSGAVESPAELEALEAMARRLRDDS